MVGYRSRLQFTLSAVLALTFAAIGRAQGPDELPANPYGSSRVRQSELPRIPTNAIETAPQQTCKVYSLADLGDDPKLCQWIAQTIPDMIQPSSWKQADAKISFYAPSKVLVINNTPAVHAQVDEFLQNMRKATPPRAINMAPGGVVQAQFNAPDNMRPAGPVPGTMGSYPIPSVAQPPKHLFHFIIRYEGAGIVDSNVVKLVQLMKEAAAEKAPERVQPPTPGYSFGESIPNPPTLAAGSSGPTPVYFPRVPGIPTGDLQRAVAPVLGLQPASPN